jgi:limonene-1,2-epoxide hydrolase
MDNNFYLNRRALMLAAGGLAGCAALPSSTDVSPNKRPMTELEQNNIQLVTQFCDDWSSMDTEHLASYLADDIVYQMSEGRPDVIGRQAFVKLMKPFMSSMNSVEWVTRYSEAIGPLVINERLDHFNAKNEKRSMHFEIAGFFLIKEGKISVWKDYSLPGGISKFGPL